MQNSKIKLLYKVILISLFFLALSRIIYSFKNYESSLNINQNVFVGRIVNIRNNTITIKINNEYLSGYYDNTEFEQNDLVSIDGNLSIPKKNKIFNGFNYRDYLYHNYQYYIININSVNLVKRNNNIFFKIKNNIKKHINNRKSYKYMNAFILGDNSYIDSNIKESFQINNISHLFAVSGMHVGLFTGILVFILDKMIRNKYIEFILICIFLIFYMFLVNYSPSVIRTVLFYILLHLNKKINFTDSNLLILIFILFILIIINPFYIYNIGFLYSFSISISLIYLSNAINVSNNYFIKIMITSFISFIVSTPITIYSTNQINILGILYNLFFVPLVSLIIFPLSLINLVFDIDFIYMSLINILESTSLFFSKVEYGLFIMKTPTLFILFILIISTLFIIYLIKSHIRTGFIIYFLLIIIYSNQNYFIKNDFITMIDVDQGDSILLHLNNKSILLDTGGNIYKSYANTEIIPYLKSLGIRKVDYLLLSHGDYDHMGDAINFVENFKTETVIFNCGSYNNLENNLIDVLNKNKIKYYSCINELNIDNYKIYFLNTREYDNENDNSNVIYFNYNGYSFLFMGDAGKEKENDLLEKYNLKNIDFLKIGHHGSDTSSSKYFIDCINPKYSLISVGKNNRYGHPKESVLETLRNSKIYRTDLDGSIEIRLNKNGYKIKTCPP